MGLLDANELTMSGLILSIAASLARLLPDSLKKAIYRSGPIAGFIRRGLNRAAPQGLTRVEVAAGGLKGMLLELDLQLEKDYWLGTYEPDLQAAIHDLVQPGWVAYDVGANIGYISLLLARAVGGQGQVISFEALPANVERLRTNLALNDRSVSIRVIPEAVIDRAGQVDFLVGPSGGMGKAAGSAGRDEVAYPHKLNVQAISLDEFIFAGGNPIPQVIKIDIEGGEVLALPGMARLLHQAGPLILMELHGPQAARVAWDGLTNAGYQISQMLPGYPIVSKIEALDWKAYLIARKM
jgi:FkbM family methyltransferase